MEDNQVHESNIDDLLSGIQSPPTPPSTPEPMESSEPDVLDATAMSDEPVEEPTQANDSRETSQTDEYGNPKTVEEKKYTQAELDEYTNRIVRERLARIERNTPPPTQTQINQQAQGFEYNSNSEQTWEQQLESFVEKTVMNLSQKQNAQQQQAREEATLAAFESKFREGTTKFKDYHEVVANQPITDAMLMASRAMSDPAAFFYAAAKREAAELQRIASIPDPYVQVVEMGRLESKLKMSKPVSNTPKPMGKTRDDMPMGYGKEKQPSIDDLIAQNGAQRLARFNQQRRR